MRLVLRVRRDPKVPSGGRQLETVERVLRRAQQVVEAHPAWTVTSHRDHTHTATIGTATAQLGAGDYLPTYTISFPSGMPGAAARVFAQEFQRWLDATAAEHHQRVTAEAQKVIRAIERLIHDLNVAIAENDTLLAQLHDAKIEIEFLRRQVDQLTESLRTGRPSIAKAMLAAVSAVLLAAVTGVAEVGTGHLVGGDPVDASTDVTIFVERCDSLVGELEALEGEHGDQWPTASPDDHGD